MQDIGAVQMMEDISNHEIHGAISKHVQSEHDVRHSKLYKENWSWKEALMKSVNILLYTNRVLEISLIQK